MNLNDFEDYFEDKILRRGYDYYTSGCVSSLEFDGEEWIVEVRGSDLYTVLVTLSETGEIEKTACDCPYDWGPFCKHQAAVFYALRKAPKQNMAAKKRPKEPKETLADVLGKLDKSTLLSVLLEYAQRDGQMEESLLLRFSQKKDAVKHAKALIKSSIRAVTHRGFVEYRDVGAATAGAHEVLRMADGMQHDPLARASLCVLVAKEMMNLMENCDDSNGHAGGAISMAICQLNDIIENLPQAYPDTEKLFALLFGHACAELYDGWNDWRMEILAACVPLCGNPMLRKQLEEYLLSLQADDRKEYYSRHRAGEAQKITHGLIAHFDGAAAAQAYIEAHLDNSDFRKIAIEAAIAKNALAKALALCLDGEEADVTHTGLVSDWMAYRFQIYEKQSDTGGMRKLAEDFVTDGAFAYYTRLKKLYPPEEWPPVLNRLLLALEHGRYRHHAYVQLLVAEKLYDRLLRYCREYPPALERLYPHLIPAYQKELDPLFAAYIRRQAEQANGRKQYQKLCGLMRHYQKACGAVSAKALKRDLMATYPRRRAMMEELDSLKM
ncbi:MAG: SWIM zinc finger family protein [Clostridiales bacterium]|jgi:hypothetical protein|nr:SWIM zinc finger family protein [Clostridiales bacterium]